MDWQYYIQFRMRFLFFITSEELKTHSEKETCAVNSFCELFLPVSFPAISYRWPNHLVERFRRSNFCRSNFMHCQNFCYLILILVEILQIEHYPKRQRGPLTIDCLMKSFTLSITIVSHILQIACIFVDFTHESASDQYITFKNAAWSSRRGIESNFRESTFVLVASVASL